MSGSKDKYNKAIELHKQGLGSLRISKSLGYNTRSAIEDWINKGRKQDRLVNFINLNNMT